jgi:hypothetical protein
MRVYITIISVMSKFNFQNGNPKQCRHMYSGKIEGLNLAEKKQGYFHKKALNSERNNSFSAPRLNIDQEPIEEIHRHKYLIKYDWI